MTNEAEFPNLDQLVRGYFHQDMDLVADTIPEAIAAYSGEASSGEKIGLEADMRLFAERFHNRLEETFLERYRSDMTADDLPDGVEGFFDMVRAVVADPEAARRYL